MPFQQALRIEQLLHFVRIFQLTLPNGLDRVDQLYAVIEIARIDGFTVELVPMLKRQGVKSGDKGGRENTSAMFV